MNKLFFHSALISFAIFTSCDKEESTEKACFTFSPESGIKVADVVTFSNCSSDASYYMWNFGDQVTSTEKNPVHSYTEPGNYTVSLAVQDSEFRDLNGDMVINQLDREPASSDIITATITVVAE